MKTLLTRKTLIRITGATINQIAYLRDMERLPIEHETTGAGRPIVYKPGAIQIVLAHIGKASLQD